MIMPHDLALYHRKHSITPTKAKEADNEEGPEKL
jgi:hypothetical protein